MHDYYTIEKCRKLHKGNVHLIYFYSYQNIWNILPIKVFFK